MWEYEIKRTDMSVPDLYGMNFDPDADDYCEELEYAAIESYVWDVSGYRPEARAYVTYDDEGLHVLLCAFAYSAHILVIDYFTQKVDGVALSCGQFMTATVLSSLGMLLTETPSLAGIMACIGPILYVGIFSSGVAYTLQILAQKDSNPTVVSLLMSLESVFATIAGAIILHDRMSGREYLGCAVMLAAVVLAQLPESKKE